MKTFLSDSKLTEPPAALVAQSRSAFRRGFEPKVEELVSQVEIRGVARKVRVVFAGSMEPGPERVGAAHCLVEFLGGARKVIGAGTQHAPDRAADRSMASEEAFREAFGAALDALG